jgi:uroporphyrinogen decarboxylase
MPMTPRQRVLAAINHEEPDRVPLIIGTSNTTSIKMETYQRLKAHLGLPSGNEKYIYDWPELGTAMPDESVLQRLKGDARGLLDRFPQAVYERNRSRAPHSPFIDDWGSGQKEIEPGVWFPGIHPLAEANTIEALESYPGWPDPHDPTRYAHLRAEAQKLRDEDQYAVIGAPWLLFPLERAFAMQGMDNFLLNMAAQPDFAEELLKKNAHFCKAIMGHFLDACGDLIDIIKIGDDIGTQESLLMSPRMYRRVLKPIHADFIASIKERTNAKVFFHTDGDVFPLIDDFIEIGVDILNPIQTSAGRMADIAELKQRYGKNLVMCGAVDTHHYLPNGTPEEVRAEVRRVIEVLGPGGGYLIASVHTIMNDVSSENILAMVDAVEEFGQYPLN